MNLLTFSNAYILVLSLIVCISNIWHSQRCRVVHVTEWNFETPYGEYSTTQKTGKTFLFVHFCFSVNKLSEFYHVFLGRQIYYRVLQCNATTFSFPILGHPVSNKKKCFSSTKTILYIAKTSNNILSKKILKDTSKLITAPAK